MIRSRFHFTTDFATRGRAYFSDDFSIEPKALKKNIRKHPELKKWLPMLADRLLALKAFTVAEAEAAIRDMADEFLIKPGVLINGVRTVVTGQLAGPGLFDVLVAVGQNRVVERLRKSIALFD